MADRPTRRATRADVARQANVAPSTVSIVLNGRAEQVHLAPATAERVRRAAAALNYVPSAAGRALHRHRSSIISLLTEPVPPRAAMPIFQDPVVAAIARARESGYLVLPVPEPDRTSRSPSFDAFAAITDVDIAGVVCQITSHNTAVGSRLVDTGIPVVWMAPHAVSDWPDGLGGVYIDEEVGSAELADYLYAAGHRRIGLLGASVTGRRFSPFLRRFDGACIRVPTGYWVEADGRAAFTQLLRHPPLPTAVVCANDLLAVGVMQAARHAGLGVPEDIAVAGFGDFDLSSDVSPSLTTVTWPLRTLTTTAIDMLIAAIDNSQRVTGRQPSRLPTAAVLRDSTAAPVPLTTGHGRPESAALLD